MKILHTSDWHIGRSLYGRKRYQEYAAFLEWFANYIDEQSPDAIIISGDIFDTGSPSNRSQELYYRFLVRIARSSCRSIVITAGNHDSPSFLSAPSQLLKALDVHVIGTLPERVEDELVPLRDKAGQLEAIICAVPYLRERDMRRVDAGESDEEKGKKLIEGIREHYRAVVTAAEELRGEADIPIIASGHLFTAGGKTMDGDGVRELYVGTLAHVSQDLFPKTIDYLALGHLHVAQRVGGLEQFRYSGSPLAIGFKEAKRAKQILSVSFQGREACITPVEVPVFQELSSISGTMADILEEIQVLSARGSDAWLEIEYTGQELIPSLRTRIEEALEGSGLEVLRIKDSRLFESLNRDMDDDTILEDLDLYEVFERRLDEQGIPEEQREALRSLYRQTVQELQEEDTNAE